MLLGNQDPLVIMLGNLPMWVFLSPWSEVLSPLLSADNDGEGEGEGVVLTDLSYTQLLSDEPECFP